ncbi:MAG: hypothetical protein LLG08_09405 [Actinomycetia bacterium]|nr:hypothetical protein [Actinomycetes bacterium]
MSDQDFFFDEEEDAKPAPKEASTGHEQVSARQAAAVKRSFFEQSVSMTIAALIAVIALLLGVIIGYVIPSADTTPVVSSPTSSTGSSTAPQLTQDQINSGALPPGHPDLSGAVSSSTATASTTATGN